jgi:type VI secretion system protein ImpG
MQDALYRLYEEELSFIRKRATEFGTRYREVAGRLLLEQGRSPDPHVERLIEAFAMVAARVRLRLDESYPELTDGLLEVLYPQALAPSPPMTIVQFELDPRQNQPDEGVPVARHTQLTTKKIGDVACRFRTTLPLRLFPLQVTALDWPRVEPTLAARDARATLRVEFAVATGVPASKLHLDALRLFLDEKDSTPGLAHALYEALLADVVAIEVRAGDRSLGVLDKSAVHPVGFAADEAALATPRQAAAGYRVLQEYFLFEQKFLFVDVRGLDLRRAGDATRFQLVFGLRRTRNDLDRASIDNVRYGCTPAVNLFPMPAMPIRLDRRTSEYMVVIDHRAPLAYEVHSLQEVATSKQEFRPFWSACHADGGRPDLAYWLATRRRSFRPQDDGTDVFVSLVEPDLTPAQLGKDDEVLHVRALCSNRDLAAQMASPDVHATLDVQGIPQVLRVRRLRPPTPSVRPDLAGESRWRIVSHLALNHLSLGYEEDTPAAREEALRALQDILRLYDTPRTAVSRQRIEGIVGLRSTRAVRILPEVGAVRGIEVELTFDETKFTGSGAFLFASVLEHFLAHHASINSFIAVAAKSRQRAQEEFIKQWTIRPGARSTL